MWTIIEKEILDNLLNQRFQVATLVAVLLTIGCIMLQTSDYSRRLNDYRLADSSQEEFLDGFRVEEAGLMNPQPLIPPKPLSPLVAGLNSVPSLSFDENFISRMFPVLDLLFIVAVIMSLVAVLFSHDAVCGERERGTLRLIHSNPVARPTLILAKWLGGSSSVLLPLVISWLAGMIFISLSPRLHLGGAEWTSVLLIMAASVAYISAFYLLGLLVSSTVRNSGAAVLVAMLAWATFVFIIPSLGPYVANRIEPVNTAEVFATRVSRGGWNRFYEHLEHMRDLNTECYKKKYGQVFADLIEMDGDKRELVVGEEAPESQQKRIWAEYSRDDYAVQDSLQHANIESLNRLVERAEQEAARRSRLARNFSAVSPFADYLYFATELAATGVDSREFDSRQTSAFYNQMRDYRRQISEIAKENPGRLTSELAARPKFVYERQPAADRLRSVLPYGVVLVLFNVVFFAGAYVAFLRYDVR